MADRFSALMMVVASPVLVAVPVFSIGQPGTERSNPVSTRLPGAGRRRAVVPHRRPVHMFVAFEMMLTASYVLITIGGRADQVRSGMTTS